MTQQILRPQPKLGLHDPVVAKGYVRWEITDENDKVLRTGMGFAESWWFKYIPSFLRRFFPFGQKNAVVNKGRSQLVNWLAGDNTVSQPAYVAVGTGTGLVASSDERLGTAILYTGGSVTAKGVNSRSTYAGYSVRYIASFATNEITTGSSSVNVRELGLFDGSDPATDNMWARVNVNITKANTEKLNIYWYLVFERREGLAIKSGTSIGTTGNIAPNASGGSALTFASNVTVLMIHNNSGVVAYMKFNGSMTGTPPTDYDLVLQDGQSYIQSDEEISIGSIYVYMNDTITMPDNQFVIRGW